jgi:hypothetical protein
MSNKENMAEEVDRLRADYALLGDGPFKHFHCPILLKDEDVELCMGHVVNKAIPNCCRRTVVQRKDIDGFYGSLLERHFATALKAKRTDATSLIFDRELRRDMPWKVLVAGKEVAVYEPAKHKSASHPTVQIQDSKGGVLNLALKLADHDLSDAGNLQVIVERSYVPEVTASLLKSAHLTMFAIFGYRQMYSPSGFMVAEILRTFFVENRAQSRKDQNEAAKQYFPKHAGMVIPLGGYNKDLIRGSIEDRRFIVCVGSSGAFYALGVFIRTDDSMHIVFLPPDEAENMDTYFELTRDMYNKKFKFQFIDYHPPNGTEGAHWEGYKEIIEFEPGPSVTSQ